MGKRPTYKGVVFDFDGVLYDSERYWMELEVNYIERHLSGWDRSDYIHLTGRPISEVYEILRARGLSLTETQYLKDYEAMACHVYGSLVHPLPHVDSLLSQLSMNHVSLAIASSSSRAWIDLALRSSPLPVELSMIASAADPEVQRGKPAPDVYLRAAHLLNAPPDSLIAIEDSQHGVAAARSAGLYTIGLKNGFNEEQDLSDAHELMRGYHPKTLPRALTDLICLSI